MKRNRLGIWTAVSSRAQAEDAKQSLPTQERDGRAWAEANGYSVVRVMRVPGHSRRPIDFHEIEQKARKKNIDAFTDLRQLWEQRGIDVLWVRDGDRFARSQSAMAFIVENLIQSGTRIYSEQDGWIDDHNYRMWIALVGYRAAGHIDRLVAESNRGKDANAVKGYPVNGRGCWAYKKLRDPRNGRITGQIPDESKRPVIEDAARLILEGVAWHDIEKALYQRFGHTRNGSRFRDTFFYNLFHTPTFWGNNARRWRGNTLANGQKTDLWVFDPTEPAPPQTLVFYNTHEPYLKGDFALKVQAELRRRRMSIRGTNRPYRSKMFSSLLRCDYCGHTLAWQMGRGTAFYQCRSKYTARTSQRCKQVRSVREVVVMAWFDQRLREMLARQDPQLLARGDTPAAFNTDQLRADIADTEVKIRRLIERQANADSALSSFYDEQLAGLAEALRGLRATLRRHEETAPGHDTQDVDDAYKTLKSMGIDEFWQQSPMEINQLLHRLLGRRRVVVRDQALLGFLDNAV